MTMMGGAVTSQLVDKSLVNMTNQKSSALAADFAMEALRGGWNPLYKVVFQALIPA